MRRLAVASLLAIAAVSCSSNAPSKPQTIDRIISGSPKILKAKLAALKGKPVVVNYWATWCEPCNRETPRVVAAAKKYAGRVVFFGVDVEDSTASAEKFAKRFGMPYESLADPRGDIRHAQTVLGLPVTQFYASDGELAFLHNGEISAKELDSKIKETLKA